MIMILFFSLTLLFDNNHKPFPLVRIHFPSLFGSNQNFVYFKALNSIIEIVYPFELIFLGVLQTSLSSLNSAMATDPQSFGENPSYG